MQRYRFLTFEDRRRIAEWYQSGDRPADIAERLGMSTKTVYTELKRGKVVGKDGQDVLDRNQRRAYNPVIAQKNVQESMRRRGKRVMAHP